MSDRKMFVTVMETLGETYNRPLTTGMLEGYWMAMSDLTPDEMQQAAATAVRTVKFMPAPSELRAFARGARSLSHEAELAWAEVRGSVDSIDYTVSEIDFGPVVNACVRQLGGWDALCLALLPDLDVWKRKEFLRLYEVFAVKDVGDVGRPLEGSDEGKPYPPRVVAIAGIPSQPQKTLEPAGADPGEVRRLITELANAKSGGDR